LASSLRPSNDLKRFHDAVITILKTLQPPRELSRKLLVVSFRLSRDPDRAALIR
jgi:hypothetical protein